MEQTKLYSEDIEKLQNDVENASKRTGDIKLELLQHYLINYIIYVNLSEEEQKDSPVYEKLSTISVLLEKLGQMDKKIKVIDPRRMADRRMMRNKDDTKKKPQSTTPMAKYKRKSEQLREKTKIKANPNINVKKSKSNKFN
jgi:hypothetical protein